MRRRGIAVLLAGAAAACGTIINAGGDGTPPPGGDAGDATAAPADDAAQGMTRDAGDSATTPEWHDIRLVTSGKKATLTEDEKTIFYDQLGSGGVLYTIFSSTRANADAGFPAGTELPAPVVVPGVDSMHPGLAPSGATLFFARRATDGGRDYDLFFATRDDGGTAGPFVKVDPLPSLDSPLDDVDPFLDGQGDLWFASPRPNGTSAIFHSPASTTGFGDRQEVIELQAVDASDSKPVVTRDGLTIYFASTREQHPDLDIWTATRPSTKDRFGTPTRVADLSTNKLDVPCWISPDGTRLYFSSERDTVRALYVATR